MPGGLLETLLYNVKHGDRHINANAKAYILDMHWLCTRWLGDMSENDYHVS